MASAAGRLAAWRAGGAFTDVACATGGSSSHRVWSRLDGAGRWLTLLHGFPTSSFDMSEIARAMAPERCVLSIDMIGFGESDRPAEHVYSVAEQADAVAAVWAWHGVRETDMVSHDLGDTVAQELLWRAQQGRLAVRIRSLVLANGGIHPELHRPLPTQTALADPEHGAELSALLTEETMLATLRPTFGPAHLPPDDELRVMWEVVSRDSGHRNLHLLIRYMQERRERASDWVGALESTSTTLGFVWGMLDPISGAHIAERIVERFPNAPRRLLEDAGHWPPIETPDAVVGVVREVDALAARSGN